jgi:hypothetical protein
MRVQEIRRLGAKFLTLVVLILVEECGLRRRITFAKSE